MKKHSFYEGTFVIEHIRNNIVMGRQVVKNQLADEGELNMLNTFFRALTTPTEFYIRLAFDTIIDTDTLSAITGEPTAGFGYAAKLIERSTTGWPTLALDSGDYMATTKEVTFTASGGDIGPVNVVYLATTSDNTGKLIAFAALNVETTIVDGDSARVTYSVKLK